MSVMKSSLHLELILHFFYTFISMMFIDKNRELKNLEKDIMNELSFSI